MVSRALIMSDGKKGHLNQSIAFCKYMDLTYDIVEIRFKNRFLKLLSYLFDRVGLYTMSIVDIKERFRNKFGMTKNSHHEQTSSHHEQTSRHPEQTSRHHEQTSSHHEQTSRHHEQTSRHHEQTSSHHEQTSSHHEQTSSHHEQTSSHHEQTSRHHEQTSRHPELVSGSTYSLVIGAGSGTYYATKVIAKKLKIKSVTMMLPRGYRYDFDVIFAQTHDNPTKLPNIIEIPANFSFIEPIGLFKPKKQSIGIVIGGNNSYLEMNKDKLKARLDFIKEQYKDFEIAVTTSPRTPKEIEELIESYHFDYEVIYSHNPINPIPDFLAHCDTVFITSDSTTMISESISYGEANVVILPLRSKKENKFDSFISKLETDGYLHIFNGIIINKNRKIDFREFVQGLRK